MKLRKIISLTLAISFLLVFLSGCIAIPVSKYYHISAEEVDSIQFYDLRAYDNLYSIEDELEPCYTLPTEQNEDFLSDFSEIKFSDIMLIVFAAVDPGFGYEDWAVRINFTNGQYTFYSCGGYGETRDSEGNHVTSTHLSCEAEDLEPLINQYYPVEDLQE